MKEKCIIFLCNKTELTRERKSYYNALSGKIKVICIENDALDKEEYITTIPSGLEPILILHPDSSPRLPEYLKDINIPTGCFQIDTYKGTSQRVMWSKFYDYAFVFHPGYDVLFNREGHPNAVVLAHAAEQEVAKNTNSNTERIYDIGWVGRLTGNEYSLRRQLIEILKKNFKMNDTERYYNSEELYDIYLKSKIVVNISRDDYLQDANLRCFETMTSGALLFTPSPSELSSLGYIENEHFVTFNNESDLVEKVKYYLAHEGELQKIAKEGQKYTFNYHTYERRAETLLQVLEVNNGKLFAPLRTMPNKEVLFLKCHYFAKHGLLKLAIKNMIKTLKYSPILTLKCIVLIGRAIAKEIAYSNLFRKFK